MRYDVLHAHTDGTCVDYTFLWWLKMEAAKRSIHKFALMCQTHMNIQLPDVRTCFEDVIHNTAIQSESSFQKTQSTDHNGIKAYVNQHNCRKTGSLSTFIAFQSIKPFAIGPKQKPRGAECYCVIVKCPQRGIRLSFSIKTCLSHALWQHAVC